MKFVSKYAELCLYGIENTIQFHKHKYSTEDKKEIELLKNHPDVEIYKAVKED